MNLAPLMDAFVALLAASLTACIPILVPKLLAMMHVNVTAQQESSLENSLKTAVGKSLAYGQAAGDSALSNVTIKNAALSHGLAFLMADAPTELKSLGYSPDEAASVIAGRLAHALNATTPAPAPSAEAIKTAEKIEAADAAVAQPVVPEAAPAPVVAS
jgi:hypothetical protein